MTENELVFDSHDITDRAPIMKLKEEITQEKLIVDLQALPDQLASARDTTTASGTV